MPQAFAEELKSIPMSPNLGESLERAHRFARDQAHRLVMLEHLLLALTEDPEASLILQSADVDLGRLSTDVSGYLGRLLEDMRSDGSMEPKPDPELLRVLQAAASAAQQSKRRQIDGAIVLAAIVGDGKSPAAGLLKTHGMTFEQAIRALQLANTKARLKPIAKAKPAPAPEPEVAPTPPSAQPEEDFSFEPEPPVEPPRPEPVAAAAPLSAPDFELELEPRARRSSPQVQSADDILAAARARIQRRAAQLTQPEGFEQQRDFDIRAVPAGQDGVSDAMRELLATATPEPAQPFNGPHAQGRGGRAEPSRPRLVPTPEPRAEAPPPFAPPQQAAFAPGPGPRPAMGPPPPMSGPQPTPAAVPPRVGAQRPHAKQQPAPPPGAPAQPVTMDPKRVRRASTPLAPFPPQQGGSKKQQGAERGPIVESVPRRMRLGATSLAEVKIARDRIDALVQSLAGRGGADVNEPVMTRALTVRLRSPSGDFFIEPASPETQWVEHTAQAVDAEPLAWAWHVTPRASGKEKLVLLVSMRSIGPGGASEEVGPPDRVLDVRVRGRSFRRFMRGIMWVLLLGLVYFLGRVGGELGPMLVKTVRQLVGA